MAFAILLSSLMTNSCAINWTLTKPSSAPNYSDDPNLIKDCPEMYIRNEFPISGPSDSYYIYKGQRRELYEFDHEWIKYNCPKIKRKILS